MINLYRILNIEPDASAKSIQAGIAIYRLREDANDKVVQAARQWLLNPQIRAQYDKQLFAHPDTVMPTAAPRSTKKSVLTPESGAAAPTQHTVMAASQINDFAHLYQFLGIHTHASQTEIATAIEEAVLEGLNGKTIQLAREQLLNATRRAQYDAEHGIVAPSAASVAAPVSDEGWRASWSGFWRKYLTKWRLPAARNHKANRLPDSFAQEVDAALSPLVADAVSDPTSAPDENVQRPEALLQDAAATVRQQATSLAAASAKPTFSRDNYYHLLGVRGDASYQEIRSAIRRARLKGRDKALLQQAQTMLLRPGNRRLYDKQHNIAAFIALQNGGFDARVGATDYRPAPILVNISVQKLLLALFAVLGLVSVLMPWTQQWSGVQTLLAWPLLISCLALLAALVCGHRADPLYRNASWLGSLSLLPAVAMMYLIGREQAGVGVYWALTAVAGLVFTPLLWGQQSKNISYRAHGQQLFAALALLTNVLLSVLVWWFIRR